MLDFNKQIVEILNIYTGDFGNSVSEPLDGDEVDVLTEKIRNRLNLFNGNITEIEFEELECKINLKRITKRKNCIPDDSGGSVL